jgi:Type IV Pilus-assembly protein W
VDAELRALLVHAYYVSVDSSLARGYPALRRKTLTSGPAVGDEEIAAGIEDLQFRIHLDTDGDGGADVTADPGALPDCATPVGVQFWLRLRAQERDHALGPTAADAYADRTWPASDDSFRRLLVTRTVLLRNGDR